MKYLSKVFCFKILFTVCFWSIPLILLPIQCLNAIGFPAQSSYMFVRLLGWAYLALTIGYWFGYQDAKRGVRLMSIIWVGIVSNGGACLCLLYFGLSGQWSKWSAVMQSITWMSIIATAFITAGLIGFGVFGSDNANSVIPREES